VARTTEVIQRRGLVMLKKKEEEEQEEVGYRELVETGIAGRVSGRVVESGAAGKWNKATRAEDERRNGGERRPRVKRERLCVCESESESESECE
jgi:hypothetical protein